MKFWLKILNLKAIRWIGGFSVHFYADPVSWMCELLIHGYGMGFDASFGPLRIAWNPTGEVVNHPKHGLCYHHKMRGGSDEV